MLLLNNQKTRYETSNYSNPGNPQQYGARPNPSGHGDPYYPVSAETIGINFARTGNPNGVGLPEWPAYNSQTDRLIEFRTDGSAAGIPDPKKARLDVIEKAVEK